MQIVIVNWVDSRVMHGWRDSADLEFDDVAYCRTVGFLQHEDSEKLILTFGSSESGFVMETITIPRGSIKTIKKLRVR